MRVVIMGKLSLLWRSSNVREKSLEAMSLSIIKNNYVFRKYYFIPITIPIILIYLQ